MLTLQIDPQLCQKCGTCVEICPESLFSQDRKGTVPQITDTAACFACGHCVAACPNGAIAHSSFPASSIHPVHPEMLPSTEQVLELLRTRRSVREFRAKAVEREVIEAIIEGARFAPSAHNVQSTEFVVIQEKAVLSQVVALTVDYLRNLVKNLRNPLIRQLYRLIAGKEIQAAIDGLEGLTEVIHRYEGGEDIILHNAPTLLLFHADRSAMFAGVNNANLALQNATLVCQALGLGNFYTGFLIAACDRDKRIAKLLELPLEHKIYGGLAIGYPKFRYPHWIERQPARIQWR